MSEELRTIDLTPAQRKTVSGLLKKLIPATEVWAYGSRVKWTSTPKSDLDLVALAALEQKRSIADLKEAFEESDLPFRVDLFIWDEVPEEFHKNIEAERVVLQGVGGKRGVGGEWKTVRLGDHVDACLGKMLDKNKNQGTMHPYLGNKDVRWGNFDLSSLSQMKFLDQEHERYGLRFGDLIVCEGGEPGRCAIWKDEIPDMKIQKALHRIRPHCGLDGVFLHYWFCYAGKFGLLDPYFTGTTIKHLTGKALAELPLPLPPLPEQKAIAHILGSLDDKIELNGQMNTTLERMAQALFKSWFVDFDPVLDNALAVGNPIPEELAKRAEVRRKALADGTANREAAKQFPAAFQFTEELGWIPMGWEVKSFGDVSICLDRKRIPLSKKQREEKKPGQIPYYGATSIMDYINEWIFEDTFLLIGEDGSVLKEDGSPFVQYIWEKSWVNNHAHVLQGASGISTEHLMLFMLSQNITAYVTGAVQLKINQRNMNSIPFVKAENKTNQHFTDCISPLYEKLKQLTEENKTLTNLRNTLLPKLISGELRIPEAEKRTEEALA